MDDEIEHLRQRLSEAEATLEAIGRGEVDAVVVEAGRQHEVFTLERADLPFRNFVETMAEGAVSLDVDHSIIYCNPAFCRLAGLTSSRLIGRSFLETLGADSQHTVSEIIGRGEVARQAAELITPEGGSIPVQLTITPGSRLTAKRTAVIVADLRTLESLARAMRDRDVAQAESSAKDRFLAVLGHELRNPLAAVTNGARLLSKSMLLDEEHRPVAEAMQRQIAQLNHLVDDLLDVARVGKGKITLRKSRVRIETVLRQVIESWQPRLESGRHRVSLEVVPNSLEVSADAVRLEQIIANLLSNGIKHSGEGTTIAIRAYQEDAEVLISIEDSGRGIAEEHLVEIFEPFAQFDRGARGLGIGLTLVRQLVELHGGSINVASPGVGRGATFTIRLPSIEARKTPTHLLMDPVDTGHSPDSGIRPKLLVVDDDVDALEMFTLLLEQEGFEVRTCTGAEGVVDAARSSAAQLILLDLDLGGQSGFDVARDLRAAGLHDPVIVACTGYSHASARQEAEESGFDAHLVKPVAVEQVMTLLERFADRLPRARTPRDVPSSTR